MIIGSNPVRVPVPGEPREVRARPVNSSTILVDWLAPLQTNTNGIIRAYQIYVQPKKSVSTLSLSLSSFLTLSFFSLSLPDI